MGGFFGAELKRAGFDAVIVEGRADKPVYLWVHDGEAEIRDASHLWGSNTKECQEAIRQELGDRLIRMAHIGPGGENMVRIASVINDVSHSAGRTGMGAVMGSKNLKAIAARGRKAPSLADPAKVSEMAKWMTANHLQLSRGMHEYGTGAAMVGGNAQGNLPVRNYSDGFFEEVEQITAETLKNTLRVGMESCYACPVRCKKVVEAEQPYKIDRIYGGPEYETLGSFGSACGVSDLAAVCKANELCAAYSLDTISAGMTIAFAMECYEKGIISKADTGGIELRFGNGEAMVQMVDQMAYRRGFGDILAEGSRLAARRIGRGAEDLAMHVKGVEIPMHEPRLKQGLGLTYSVEAHGADHTASMHDTMFSAEAAGIQEARAFGILDPLPSNDLGPAKVRLAKEMHQWRLFLDSVSICSFVRWNYNQVIDMVRATTGWNTSLAEASMVGERIVTMARAFNMREGLTAADDQLPKRFFSPTPRGALKETAIDPAAMHKAIHTFYRMMGWNDQTGVPTAEKMQELGIGWAVESLAR